MRQHAIDRLSGPGIGLIVTGVLGIVLALFTMLMLAFGLTSMLTNDPSGMIGPLLSGSIVGFLVALNLVLSILALLAGVKMRQARAWGLCMAGTICAMLPCSGCCILGIPVGVWALVVLLDQDVRRAYRDDDWPEDAPTPPYPSPQGPLPPPPPPAPPR